MHLVLCGHNHTYSRSKPIYCGYNGEPNNTKYDPKGQMTAEQETALGCGTINHNPDPNNGTTYLMCQATGYKNKGKETIQNPTPWWYGWIGSHPSQPSYITLDIAWDKITINTWLINGILSKDRNGNTIVADYGTQEITLFDEHVINWRTKGQTKI